MSILDSVSFVRDYWAEAFFIGVAGIYFVKGVGYFGQWLSFRVGFRDALGFYIGGKWITQYVDPNANVHAESATLHQRGRSISGTIKNEVQAEAVRKYRVRGSIRGNVLVATYEKKGWRPGIDRGAFTLQLDNTTMAMKGQYCWTDDKGHAPPISGQYNWYRHKRVQWLRIIVKVVWARVARRGVYVGRNAINGKGVIAAGPMKVNKLIAEFRGFNIPSPSRHSLFLGGSNVDPIGVLRWLNHSCQPNAAFTGLSLCATTDIKRGDEVTVDYAKTDKGRLLQPFDCICGQDLCRGRIS